jgi:hypothetical protein
MRFALSTAALAVSSLAISCGGPGVDSAKEPDIVEEEIQRLTPCQNSPHQRPCQEALGQSMFQGIFLGKGDFAPKLPEIWGVNSPIRSTSGNFTETAARIRQLGEERAAFCKTNPSECHALPGQSANQLSDALVDASKKITPFNQGRSVQSQVQQRIQQILNSDVDGTLYDSMRTIDPDVFVTMATEATSGNPVRVSKALSRATDVFLVATVPPTIPPSPFPPTPFIGSGTIFVRSPFTAASPAAAMAGAQCVNVYIAVDIAVVAVAAVAVVTVAVADRSPWGPSGLRNTVFSGTVTQRFNHVSPPPNPTPQGSWTPWIDRDDPTGNGDGEHLGAMMQEGYPVCANPTAVDCRRIVDGIDWTQTGEVGSCTTAGFVCLNADQPDQQCDDYEVRFYCP